jgi:hypothetical protein
MKLTWLLAFVLSLGLVGCDKKKGDDDGDGEGDGPGGNGGGGGDSGDDVEVSGAHYGKTVLKSSGLALTTTAADGENCGFSLDIYRGEGACFTPLAVSGFAVKVDLVADVANGRGGTRLMSPDEATVGPGVIWAGAEFDLDDTGAALVGNNTLWDEYGVQPTFAGVGVDFAYVRYQVALKDQFVTVLLPAYSQPFRESAKALCSFGDDIAQQPRFADADLLPGMTFERGDYLFCVKDTADAACAAADYQWLDDTSKTLVDARPANPKRSGYLSGEAVTCTDDGDERYGFNFKLSAAYATIAAADQFKLYGDFSYGELSNQWPTATTPMGQDISATAPYVIYYHEANGTKSEGTELVTTIDFDTANSLFVENLRLTDIDAASMGTVLSALQIKSQWAFDKKFADGVSGGFASHYAGMSAKVTVGVAGGTNPPRPAAEL